MLVALTLIVEKHFPLDLGSIFISTGSQMLPGVVNESHQMFTEIGLRRKPMMPLTYEII